MVDFVKKLRDHSYYNVYMLNEKPIIVFEDHRFVIPVLWLAQKLEVISPGIDMIRFDAHMDAVECDSGIQGIYSTIEDFNGVFEFARTKLRQNDDDWLTFATDVELVGNSVTFHEGSQSGTERHREKIYRLSCLEGELASRGQFGDHVNSEHPINSIVGWDWSKKSLRSAPILLDIDCDYFTFSWRGKTFPWQRSFYQDEFSPTAEDVEMNGWTNLKFIKIIIKRAPFVTICLEHGCCGGKDNAKAILGSLNSVLFEDVINLKEIYV